MITIPYVPYILRFFGSATAAPVAVYSTIALGLAGTTSGRWFGVPQTYGAAIDYYLNSSGSAVFQLTQSFGVGASAEMIQIQERSSSVVTQYPVTPLISLNSIDMLTWDQRLVPNRSAASLPTKNIIGLNTGDIRSASASGLTITKNYATGPSGSGTTAERIVFAGTSNAFLFYSAVTPPAGNYRMTYKVKLNAGEGTKNLRYGNLTAGLTTVSINDATWTTITHDFTASGSDYTSLAIYPGTGATVPYDLLLDEVQFYDRDGVNPPAFTAETKGWHYRGVSAAFRGRLARSGFVLDNNSAGACGTCTATEFPSTKTFSALTAFVAVKYETSGTGQVLVTETDATLGTTANTLNVGVAAAGTIITAPINMGTTNANILGQGWQIFGIRLAASARTAYLQEIEMNSDTTAFAGFAARLLCIGGQTTATPMKGKIAIVNVWDSALSDADVQTAVASMRQRIALIGETMGTFRNFYLAEGDSRTALSTNSYAFLMANAGEFTPNLYMRNFAVSGSGAADLTARLAAVQKVAAQAQLNGRRLIISVLIGINDASTMVSGGASAYYTNTLKPLWAAYRATGAKLIVCTELTDNGATAGYNAARNALNVLIRGDTSLYDALCDFASDATMGIDNSRSTYPTDWTDNLHPTAAGHLLLKPYMSAAIASLLA